ncbi:MAG: hypothetical protein ACTHJL_12735 [Amnibacterium sp.]
MTTERPIVPLTLLGGGAPACEGPDCVVPDPSGVDSSTGASQAG